MALRLFLLSHAATPATRAGIFPHATGEDALDARGLDATHALQARLHPWLADLKAAVLWRSPAFCAEQTALALGLNATPCPHVNDLDYGHWAGQRLADIAVHTPEGLGLWLRTPTAAPHGGESFDALGLRLQDWLQGLEQHPSDTHVLITHASVMRALIGLCRNAPAQAWRLDIQPLSLQQLLFAEGQWLWQGAFLPTAEKQKPA
jgi:broad specificity phosphatase PhoE